jgi:uncharacterized protein YbgA (DUF1722 family)/uncharacterized protein YbbK (DUF523 family)
MAESLDLTAAPPRVRVGVSACLLGERVRFDGQHNRDGFVVDELGKYVDWVPVCPEVEVGMGVPREAVRLLRQRASETIRMVGCKSGEDWTSRMERFAAARVKALADEDLAGFVFKARSPSCGMARVKVYDAGAPRRTPEPVGTGLFAAALAARLPNLPVEEEGRLTDARLRESFIERLFAYARLRVLWGGRWTLGALVRFHTAHKMALLAHSTDGYRALGRLVGEGIRLPRAELRERYEAVFMRTLARPTTPGRHANVLMHMLGHVSDRIDEGDRRELLEAIDRHRVGRLPLIVPLTLLAHHARRCNVAYLLEQTYLHPRGDELLLRNRA